MRNENVTSMALCCSVAVACHELAETLRTCARATARARRFRFITCTKHRHWWMCTSIQLLHSTMSTHQVRIKDNMLLTSDIRPEERQLSRPMGAAIGLYAISPTALAYTRHQTMISSIEDRRFNEHNSPTKCVLLST